jgi:hypothetical protein
LGDLVRSASEHKGPWPKISVWHGSADHTVNPANANEIVKQWLDVHHLPLAPMSNADVDGYPREVWWNADGETIVESYTITDMAHGTPLGIADNDERYGAEGAFLIEAGISSSHHIASFFGLTERISRPRAATAEVSRPTVNAIPAKASPAKTIPAKAIHAKTIPAAPVPAKPIPLPAPAASRKPDVATVLEPIAKLHRSPETPPRPRRRAIDVGAVITRALTAAGLMK